MQTEHHAEIAPEGFVRMPAGYGFNDVVQPFFYRSTPERFTLGFQVQPEHCNALGNCHGGALMTFADIALAASVGHHMEMMIAPPTISMSCDFLAPGKPGDWLESRIDHVQITRTIGFCNGMIVGPNGPVLRFNGTVKLPSKPEHLTLFNKEQTASAVSGE